MVDSIKEKQLISNEILKNFGKFNTEIFIIYWIKITFKTI